MSSTAYIFSISLHVIAATVWIGGMIFMAAILLPALNRMEDPVLRGRLMREAGSRFRTVGWVILGTLLVSGYTNLTSRGMGWAVLKQAAFWREGYGFVLGIKLAVFLLILAISLWHDFHIGPKAGRAARERPGQPETLRLRALATWFGVLNLLLALVMLVLGLLLSRGITG